MRVSVPTSSADQTTGLLLDPLVLDTARNDRHGRGGHLCTVDGVSIAFVVGRSRSLSVRQLLQRGAALYLHGHGSGRSLSQSVSQLLVVQIN